MTFVPCEWYYEHILGDNCNNCGSRNLGDMKDSCKYMKDGLCGKGASSTGECKIPCSFYEKW